MVRGFKRRPVALVAPAASLAGPATVPTRSQALAAGSGHPRGHGLHDIWGMTNTTAMATLSLAIVGLFAVALTAVSIRVFNRSAVN